MESIDLRDEPTPLACESQPRAEQKQTQLRSTGSSTGMLRDQCEWLKTSQRIVLTEASDGEKLGG